VMRVAEARYEWVAARSRPQCSPGGWLQVTRSPTHKLWFDRVRWRLGHPVIFCAWGGRARFAGHWFGRRELEVLLMRNGTPRPARLGPDLCQRRLFCDGDSRSRQLG